MELLSSAFKNNEQISTRYTCDGEDIHPPLEIVDPPKGVKSYCIIMDDLDAEYKGAHWLHWTMWNIHPHTTLIKPGKVPAGTVQGKTSADTYHYVGPCPPDDRRHRYRFRLFALDTELEVSPNADAEELEEEMNGHVLEKADLFGTYDRNGRAIWEKHAPEELGPVPESSRLSPEGTKYGEEE